MAIIGCDNIDSYAVPILANNTDYQRLHVPNYRPSNEQKFNGAYTPKVNEEIYELGVYDDASSSAQCMLALYDITNGIDNTTKLGEFEFESSGGGNEWVTKALTGTDVILLEAGHTYAIGTKVNSSVWRFAYISTGNNTVASNSSDGTVDFPSNFDGTLNIDWVFGVYAKTRMRVGARFEQKVYKGGAT